MKRQHHTIAEFLDLPERSRENKDWVNVQHEAPDTVAGKTGSYNWRTDIRSWRYVPDNKNGTDYETVQVTSVDEFSEAKRLEIFNWRENGVFGKVDFTGQQLVSVRWVLTVKETTELAKQDL